MHDTATDLAACILSTGGEGTAFCAAYAAYQIARNISRLNKCLDETYP
jgi:hypothetical protein